MKADASLDREIQDTKYVTVIVTDGGGLVTTATLEIDITDENDNAPR